MSWSGGRSPRLPPGTPGPPRHLSNFSQLSPFSFSEDTLKILASDLDRQNGIIPLNLPLNSPKPSGHVSISQPNTPGEERKTLLAPSSPNCSSRPPFNLSMSAVSRPCPPQLGHSQSVGSGSLQGTPGRTMRDYDESFKDMKKENFNLKLRIFFLEERMGLGKNASKEELEAENVDLKVQLESCRQDLSEKAALVVEASQALEQVEQSMREQEVLHREQLARLEKVGENGNFRLESVPAVRKQLRSPNPVRRKQQLFVVTEDQTNNNLLGVLEEQEEEKQEKTKKCDFDHETKIKEMELMVARTETRLEQVKLSLETNEEDFRVLMSQWTEREEEISEVKRNLEAEKQHSEKLESSLEERAKILASQEVQLRRWRRTENNFKIQSTQTNNEEEEQAVMRMEKQLKLQVQERKLLLKKISMLKEQLSLPAPDTPDLTPSYLHHLPDSGLTGDHRLENTELGIQCDLGHAPSILEAYSASVSRYREIIVNLNKKLTHSTEACDTLREQLEEILDTTENAVEEGNMDKIRSVLVKSRSVSRNLSKDLYIDSVDSEEEPFENKFDNPLSEASTWNMELPNLADMQLCSSPDLCLGPEQAEFDTNYQEDLCNNVIQHLNEQIEMRNCDILEKVRHITRLEEELQKKEEIIMDQSDTIDEYRCRILNLEEGLYGPNQCPEQQKRIDKRHQIRKVKRRKKDSRLGKRLNHSNKQKLKEAAALSIDSDTWSEPDRSVSLCRIGLPFSYPMGTNCNCAEGQLLSDSEDNQINKLFYSLEFSHLDSAQEPQLHPPDYSQIIEELQSHRREIKKFQKLQVEGGPTTLNQDEPGFECDSSACLSSGHRILSSLMDSLMHQLELCHQLDSGIETADIDDLDESREEGEISDIKFDLCSKCTSSIPKEIYEILKSSNLGLDLSVKGLEKLRRNFCYLQSKLESARNELEMTAKGEAEAKEKLNENYVLIAKLSSENLRLLGEHSKIELQLEEVKRCSSELELELEDKICCLTGRLGDKEIEVADLRGQLEELGTQSKELHKKLDILQDTARQKDSPDTSSSFDFLPISAKGMGGSPIKVLDHSSRPRAYSLHGKTLAAKTTEVSSPDLGVGMESDPFSSLERGNSHRVAPPSMDRILKENKVLRQDKEVLTQKLTRSKSALQETLLRLSKSNIQKAGQVSPAVGRRSPTNTLQLSERGLSMERDGILERTSLFGGTKPRSLAGGANKSK